MLITEYLMAGKKKDLRWLGYNSSHTSFARSAAGLQHGLQLNSENWCFWDLRLLAAVGGGSWVAYTIVRLVSLFVCSRVLEVMLSRSGDVTHALHRNLAGFLSCRVDADAKQMTTHSQKKLRTLNIQVGTLSLSLSLALTFAHTPVSFQQRLVAYTPGPSPVPSCSPSELERTRRHP
jgi:hypothetical protein